MNQLYRRTPMKGKCQQCGNCKKDIPEQTDEINEKHDLLQIPPDQLTVEQQHKLIEWCRTDPAFFFQYVGLFNIEKTALLNSLQERLITDLGTKRMMDGMFTLHGRREATIHIEELIK